MSFLQFCRILWARRWIIIAATAACFLAAVLAALILPARYEAKSRVMMELIKPDPVTGQVMGTNFARAYTATQTELIRDYRVTGAVVDNLGWTSSPDLLAAYNASGAAGNTDFRRWLAQTIATNTRATPIEGSNILEITYTANNPEGARIVADAVRKAYVDQSLAFKREAARSSADWFDRQIVKVRGQLATAEQRKTAFERQNNIVIQDDDSDTESTRLKALAGSAAAAGPSIVGGGSSPAALQLAQIDARIASEATALGPNHPAIQDLRRQRQAVAAAAAQERSAGAVTGGGPSIAGQVAAQRSLVIAQRDKVQAGQRLQADIAVLRDQYSKTAARAAELRQQAESDESGLTLLGSAVTPEKASFPNIPLILFGSLAFGLGLGLLIALVTEMLSRRVRSAQDLAGLGLPVVVVLTGTRDGAPAAPRLMERLRLTGGGA